MKKKRLETVARVLAVLLLFEIGVHAQSVLWQENFDNVTAPALPIGWITDAGFETSTSVEGPDSGLNNLMHKGATFGHLDTPPLNLSQVTSASLVYNARRTGSYNYSALRILGSADGGITFPYIVVDAGEALPGEDSEYMPCSGQLPDDLIGLADVRFRFETQGGGSSSASIRIDDVRLTGEGDIPSNRFGFRSDTETVYLTGNTVYIPLDLHLALTNHGLQGLQFEIEFDESDIQIDDLVRMAPDILGPDWQLDTEVGSGILRAVLLGHGTVDLAPGTFVPFLQLEMTVLNPDLTTSTVLAIRSTIASEADPAGSDLPVTTIESTLALLLEPTTPQFVTDRDTVDFGVVRAGNAAEQSLVVTNDGGTGALVIDSVRTSDPLFVVSPDDATIGIDDNQTFSLTVSPVVADAGNHDTNLVFYHNASGGESTVPVLLTVLSGRGDINEDQVVDIVDLVWGIDIVLERIQPTAEQFAAADIYPFSSGDGQVDVRDLTVLTQAIARGIWPDDMPLESMAFPMEKSAAMGAEAGEIHFTISDAGINVRLESHRPIRALHVVFDLPDDTYAKQATLRTAQLDGIASLAVRRETDGAFSLVLYQREGGHIEPGVYDLGDLLGEGAGSGTLGIKRAEAVDINRDRVRLSSRIMFSGMAPGNPDGSHPLLGQPWPVPLLSGGELSVPMNNSGEGAVTLSIFDVIGREVLHMEEEFIGRKTVFWNGRDQHGQRVGPGVYVLRATDGQTMMSRSLVVVR